MKTILLGFDTIKINIVPQIKLYSVRKLSSQKFCSITIIRTKNILAEKEHKKCVSNK